MPRSLLLLALLPLLAACTDTPDAASPDPTVDSTAASTGADDQFAIHTHDGTVKLALTDETVYFWLSEETMQEVENEVARETEGLGDFAKGLADYVGSEVMQAVRDQMQYRIDEIRDIRYENGRLVFDFVDPSYEQPTMRGEGEPVTGRFPPDDARRFVEAFREAKAER